MILDTNALSAAGDAQPGILPVLSGAHRLAIPVIVIGEYLFGISQSRHKDSYERWLSELLGDCDILDITEQTTRHYRDVALQLRKSGKPIPTNDLWIAALCHQHKLPLLSRDQHFDVVNGINRISW